MISPVPSTPLECHSALEGAPKKAAGEPYPPLEYLTRPAITTNEAAYYLNRKEQTLRSWASLQNGPLCPRRVGGRLAWSVQDIKKLLGVK